MRNFVFPLLFALVVAFNAAAGKADEQLPIGLFSKRNLAGWQERSFAGHTEYQLVPDSGVVLRARSERSASAYGKAQKVDLRNYPVINWRWKVVTPLTAGINEKSAGGDDFAARVYVIVDGGLFKWRTKTLTYVWASQRAVGEYWRNPHNPKNAAIIVLRSGTDAATWHSETRNVRQDFELAFGTAPRQIDGVALMTDSDNTGGVAEAYYGDIYFSER